MKKGMMLTNDFHMFRAKKIAAKQGLQLEGLPAETPKEAIVIPSNIRVFCYYAILVYESNIVKVIPPSILAGFLSEILQMCHVHER